MHANSDSGVSISGSNGGVAHPPLRLGLCWMGQQSHACDLLRWRLALGFDCELLSASIDVCDGWDG